MSQAPAKKRQASLFLLVQQLSLVERRLFIRNQSGAADESPLYIKLLNLVAASAKPEDDVLQQKLELGNVEYRQLKKYLSDKLVQWLAQQQDISPRVDIGKLLAEAEVYYLRGMVDEAMVALAKADHVAKEYEFLEERMAVLQWQLKLSMHQNLTDLAQQVLAEHANSTAALQQLEAFQVVMLQLQILDNTLHIPRTDAEQAQYQELLQNPLLAQKAPNLSIRAQLIHALVLSKTLRMVGQYEQSLVHLQRSLDVLQRYPAIRLSNPNLVIDTYKNLGLTYLALGMLPQLETFLAQAAQMQFLSSSQNQKLVLLVGRLQMSRAIATGQLDHAVKFALETEKELAAFIYDPVLQTEVAYTITEVLVLSGKVKEALNRLTQLINSEMVYGKQRNFEAALRLIEIVVHAELGHVTFIQNRLRSLKRIMSHNQGTSTLEQMLLTVLLPYAKAPGTTEKLQLLLNLKQEMTSVPTASINERHFSYFFDLSTWLGSRIQALNR